MSFILIFPWKTETSFQNVLFFDVPKKGHPSIWERKENCIKTVTGWSAALSLCENSERPDAQ